MADSTISNRVWNIAGILFDGGVSNSDYLEQITYLLFLKMVDEDMKMPEELRWTTGATWNFLPIVTGHYSCRSQARN